MATNGASSRDDSLGVSTDSTNMIDHRRLRCGSQTGFDNRLANVATVQLSGQTTHVQREEVLVPTVV